MERVRVFCIVAGSLVWLSACTSAQLTEAFNPGANANAAVDLTATGTVEGYSSGIGLLGTDPKDDLSLGKHHFRQENFGLAEHYFRRAAESHPRDAEAWLGLAASYDRLRRFELADRAYGQVLEIYGPTPEVLNNLGYSYLLRGDFKRARIKLTEAAARDPDNPYIRNNVELLEVTQRNGKGLR